MVTSNIIIPQKASENSQLQWKQNIFKHRQMIAWEMPPMPLSKAMLWDFDAARKVVGTWAPSFFVAKQLQNSE